jgi:transposase
MKLLEEDLRVRSAVTYEKRAALLCTYSPDFNPVEEAFSKIKGALGQAQS